MKHIIGINHIGLRVSELESAKKFYSLLGFEFIAGPIGPEPVAIMEHPSGINLNLILNANTRSNSNVLMDVPEKHPGFTHFALDVDDLASVQKEILALGITITEGPIILPDGGQMFFIRDQDKNVIEFHQNGK